MRLTPERTIAILAAAAGIGLFAAVPGAVHGFWIGLGASEWTATYARVKERHNVTLPYLWCFVPDVRYSLIEYQYEPHGRSSLTGRGQAPIRPDVYPGATIEIKYNPGDVSQSLPAMSVTDYRNAHGATLLVAPLLGIGLFWTANRLWREGRR